MSAKSTTQVIAVTPTIGTAVYASGDQVGGLITFPSVFGIGGAGVLVHSLVVADASAQAASMELWLFDQTVTPAADNAAFSISDADAAKCVGVIVFGPYYSSALNSVSTKSSIGLLVQGKGADLYGLLCVRGTPTYAAASDLTVRLVVIQD